LPAVSVKVNSGAGWPPSKVFGELAVHRLHGLRGFAELAAIASISETATRVLSFFSYVSLDQSKSCWPKHILMPAWDYVTLT
jgi:hypothetical protein